MPFRGTSRRYDSPAVDYGNALRRASGGAARIDTSYMEEQNRVKERQESRGAELAMTPGVRKGRVPSWEEPTGFDSDPSLQPQYFEEAGDTYTFDPRAKIAYESAARRRPAEDAAALDTRTSEAEGARRIKHLVDVGYSQRDAAREVYAGGRRSMDEERELIEARGMETRQRDEAMQASIRERQESAQRERAKLSQLLEASRSGDRAADRDLRAQIGLVATYDRELDDIATARRKNALNEDPMSARLMDDGSLAAARQQIADLDAREQAVTAQRESVRGNVAAPKAPGGGAAASAPAPAEGQRAGESYVDFRTRTMREQRAGGGGGAPVPAPAKAAPGAAPAAAPAKAAPAKPLADRVLELKRQGLSREQALKVLKSEGYDVDQE